MNVIIALLTLAALVAVAIVLVRDVVRDGLGTRPTPRSHREELGSWRAQQLQR